MTRSAAALVGAALVVGCAPVTTFDMLATSDRDLFEVCKPALLDLVCKDGDIVARADCLESRGAAYGQLHSPRMRRSWLIANGCPESTVDTPPKPEVLAVAPPPAPAPAPAPNKPADPIAAPAPAPAPPARPMLAAPVPAPAAPPAIAAAPPPPKAAPPPPPEPEPPLPLMAASARPPAEPGAGTVTPPPTPPAAPPAAAPPAAAPPPPAPAGTFSERERGELRERRLRDIIIAHGKEMRSCVDRQLKLVPDLRADGTLVIDVDANGAVPHAELLGTDLAGTPLEACLRTVASRWRFPSNGRAYRIDAPVKVSGSARGR